MNRMLLGVTVPGALLLALGCERISAPRVQTRSLPIPTVVSSAAIPRPFSSSTYFLYGGPLGVGVDSVLSELLHGGIPVRDAWYPKAALCMALLPDYLIVRIAAPDGRIEALGFTRDSTLARVGCTATFLHWDFRSDP